MLSFAALGDRGVNGVLGLVKPDLVAPSVPGTTLMERLLVFVILRSVRLRSSEVYRFGACCYTKDVSALFFFVLMFAASTPLPMCGFYFSIWRTGNHGSRDSKVDVSIPTYRAANRRCGRDDGYMSLSTRRNYLAYLTVAGRRLPPLSFSLRLCKPCAVGGGGQRLDMRPDSVSKSLN